MKISLVSLALFFSLPLAVSLAAEASNADALKERIIRTKVTYSDIAPSGDESSREFFSEFEIRRWTLATA